MFSNVVGILFAVLVLLVVLIVSLAGATMCYAVVIALALNVAHYLGWLWW